MQNMLEKLRAHQHAEKSLAAGVLCRFFIDSATTTTTTTTTVASASFVAAIICLPH
jgi:hypothetical protein